MIGASSLARLAHPAAPASPRCELCAAPIAEPHRHVVERGRRGVLCTCPACALLFQDGEPGARYRTVPDRVRVDRAPALPAASWAALGIPVRLAMLRRDGATGAAVLGYVGPAGIVEADVADAAWRAIAAATPLAADLADDVEALLIRTAHGGTVVYAVPVTAAFELAARLRVSWRGVSGGSAAERELAAFFAALDQRARSVGPARDGRST